MYRYLDHNATTPVDERVLEAMLPYLKDGFGNPSSVHRMGRAARRAVEVAREQVAELINGHPSQVVFTSGGTEANNLAIKAFAGATGDRRVAISGIEHASVLEPARYLARNGWQVDRLEVDGQGRVNTSALLNSVGRDTRLVSIMLANNETGVIQDIAALVRPVHDQGQAIFHTDAVQALGKIPVDFRVLGVQMMSLSAHKIYGPKGVGALVVDKTIDIEPLLHGGGHEKGRRAGTENVAAIVGFGAAARLAGAELKQRSDHCRSLVGALEARLRTLQGIEIFSSNAQRLPNTVFFSIPGLDGEMVLMRLDQAGCAVSSGSACDSGSADPSHVLLAMGVERQIAQGSIRVSFGLDNSLDDVEHLFGQLKSLITELSPNRFVAGQ